MELIEILQALNACHGPSGSVPIQILREFENRS